MSPQIGSLCTGYGGLDEAVRQVFGGELAWVSDLDKGARKILAHRYPTVPNIGDLTVIDWATLPPIEILCAGYPCQPFSHAGRRKGTDDVRHLWPYVREAIRVLRPRLTLLENVAGHRSLGFDRVLGDLAEDGMHVRWTSIRASDIGAPHRRERLFIAVAPESSNLRLERTRDARCGRPRSEDRLLPTPRATDGTKGGPNERGSRGDLMLPSAVALLPTPTGQDASNNGGPSQFERNTRPLNTEVLLLPTPAVNDMGAGKTVDDWDAWTDRMKAEHGNGNGHGKSLSLDAQRLLPTPTVQHSARNSTAGRSTDAKPHAEGDTLADLVFDGRLLQMPSAADGLGRAKEMHGQHWGNYAAAIARWERVLGRPAPAPTMTSTKGNPQLSPVFVEWLMGLPEGWVTDVTALRPTPTPGVNVMAPITRNEALKALGNGVVPQQAAAAIRLLLGMEVAA